jgi:hypothetical protein
MENTNYPLQEKIQSFVNGEAEAADRQALLQAAAADPETADELAFSRSLNRALQHRELLAAKASLGAIMDQEGFPPPSSAGGGSWWRWGSAVVLVLSLALGSYFWAVSSDARTSASSQLAQQRMQALENVLYVPQNNQSSPQLEAGMRAYDAKQYPEAARLLEQYTRSNPDNTARLYQGIAALLAQQSKEALAPLALAAQSSEPPVREAALWYLALAQLEQNKPGVARQTLLQLPPDGLYGPDAADLLKSIPND